MDFPTATLIGIKLNIGITSYVGPGAGTRFRVIETGHISKHRVLYQFLTFAKSPGLNFITL